MNSFSERESFDFVDIDDDDHLLRDGGPPMDEIIRAYMHFTRKLKYWPRPSIPRTRWHVESYHGPEVMTDEGPDCTELKSTFIELRDFNDELLATYRVNDDDRLRFVSANKANKNLRESRKGIALPGKRVQ